MLAKTLEPIIFCHHPDRGGATALRRRICGARMKATVSHYEIPAGDPERAAHFYRQVFGWRVEPLAWERPYYKIRGSAVPSELGREGIDGGIAEAGGGLEHPLLIIHIEDADLQTVLERIAAAGGTVDLPATRVGTMGWWARFRDSEGNLLGLWQAG